MIHCAPNALCEGASERPGWPPLTLLDRRIYAASTRYRVQRFQSAMDELDRMDPERMHALEDRDMWIVRANYRNGTFFGDDSEEG